MFAESQEAEYLRGQTTSFSRFTHYSEVLQETASDNSQLSKAIPKFSTTRELIVPN
jgi:hypothetical protein